MTMRNDGWLRWVLYYYFFLSIHQEHKTSLYCMRYNSRFAHMAIILNINTARLPPKYNCICPRYSAFSGYSNFEDINPSS